MFATNESKVGAVLLLTMALLMITGVYPQYVLVMTLVAVAIGVIFGVYLLLTGRKKGERQDERSERCSLLATQNGFLAAILLTAFIAVIIQMGAQIDILNALRSVWGLSMTAYFLSYLAYKRFAIA